MPNSVPDNLALMQADAIANYSHLFRRSEGMYLTFPHVESMEQDFLEQTKGRDIQLFVCSDAEAILGIGDQGVGVRASIFHFAVISRLMVQDRVSAYVVPCSLPAGVI